MSGYILQPVEAAVVELLITARRIEPHDFDEHRVEEVGNGRIVECQMAILADSRTDNVRRIGSQ